MFTGIIEEMGTIIRLDSGMLTVSASIALDKLKEGDSIAVNGVCLTASYFDEEGFSANVMEETFKKTNLGSLQVGSLVNLERALRLSDRLGGHLVSGHVDGPGEITDIEFLPLSTVLTIKPAADLLPLIAQRGSIAVDGVSLTVVDVSEVFTVSLVKHTLEHTNLSDKQVGDVVNLETDMLAKYVQKLLAADEKDNEGTTVQKLFKAGFLS